MSISAKTMGVIIGFAFGVIWVTVGIVPAFICAAFAIGGTIIGWLLDGMIEGRVNIGNVWSAPQTQTQHSHRHLS